MEFDFATNMKDVGLDEYGSKIGHIKTQNISDLENYSCSKIFWTKKNYVDLNYILYQKFLWAKKFKFRPKKFLAPKFFQTQKSFRTQTFFLPRTFL